MSRLDPSLLAGLPVFEGVDREGLGAILARASSMRVEKDTAIFDQDEEADRFFLLLDGNARVVKSTPDGRQVIVRYIVAGELMGIAQALGRDTYPASALAVVDCVVLAWPGKLWSEFASAYPTFGKQTYKVIGQRLTDVQTQMVEMATQQVEQRIAHAVLRLARQSGRKTDDGVVIDFPLSRQDIGDMTGTTLHTVSRTLSAWEDQGLVSSARQQVTVTSPHKLMLLADGRTDKF